jgi:acetylornithine deacetylase/succinyl-diaminopimelate desuccinylase-like protein
LVNVERLAQRTLDLTSIPSPSGSESKVAESYADLLAGAGLSVELDREFPESPSVIARSPDRPGPVLQFAGHLDTISTAHRPPVRRGDVIFGRGACDMKGGLAALVEVAEVIAEAGLRLPGSLLFTAYGQHEEPAPTRPLHGPLAGLLRRGIKGGACLIPEGPHRSVSIVGRGLMIFRVEFLRVGEPVHEVLAGFPPPPNPIMACHRFVAELQAQSRTWELSHPLAGPESFFVGAMHGGDYYNRIPTSAHVQGTRRYPPGRDYGEVRAELEQLARSAARECGVVAAVECQRSGQPFSIRGDDPLVLALRDSYRDQVGVDLPEEGVAYTGDVSHFVNTAGVTALYHGTDQTKAHADVESVPVAELVRCTRVLIGAALRYLSAANSQTRPVGKQ